MNSKKILSILVIAMLLLVCILNSKVFATDITTIDASNTAVSIDNSVGTGTLTITSGNTASANNTVNNNTVSNNTATNNTINNLVSIGETNNTSNNVSSYNKTNNVAESATNKAGLPYTGSSSSIIFILIALVISTVYALKKFKEYNV